MTVKLPRFLKRAVENGDVASAIREYERGYGDGAHGGTDLGKVEYRSFVKLYFTPTVIDAEDAEHLRIKADLELGRVHTTEPPVAASRR